MKNILEKLTGRSIGAIEHDYVYLDDLTYPKVSTGVINQAKAIAFDNLKESKLREIDKLRDEKIQAGFECNGHIYDSDQKSIQRISAITTLSLMNPEFTTPYITKDNTTVTLDATDIAAIGQAAAAHEANYIFLARGLKDQVLVATTEEELEQVAWPE